MISYFIFHTFPKIMTQHDQISAFIDNELTHDAEQDFLISLASNDGVRKAFRSELVLKNVIHQDEMLTTPNRDVRGAILATLGIGTATALTASSANAATTVASTGMKALFATKINMLLTATIITASAATGFVASSVINHSAAPTAQKIERAVAPQTNLTAPSPEQSVLQAVEVSQDAPKQTAKRIVGQTKAPLVNPETNASQENTLTTSGTGGAIVKPDIKVNPKKP